MNPLSYSLYSLRIILLYPGSRKRRCFSSSDPSRKNLSVARQAEVSDFLVAVLFLCFCSLGIGVRRDIGGHLW